MYLTTELFVLDYITRDTHVPQGIPCSRYSKFYAWIKPGHQHSGHLVTLHWSPVHRITLNL